MPNFGIIRLSHKIIIDKLDYSWEVKWLFFNIC